ncbi:MAG: DUF4307 domain-containing protein [Leucobacter sp.]
MPVSASPPSAGAPMRAADATGSDASTGGAGASGSGTSGADDPSPADRSGAVAGSAQSLEDRYGTGRRRSIDRRFAWGAAGALALAGIGFLLFSGWQDAHRVDWQDIGYTQVDPLTLDVKFEVTGPAHTPVACAVEALNTAKATVGWKVVEMPVSEQRTHTVTIRLVTTNPASATTVRECWVIE